MTPVKDYKAGQRYISSQTFLGTTPNYKITIYEGLQPEKSMELYYECLFGKASQRDTLYCIAAGDNIQYTECIVNFEVKMTAFELCVINAIKHLNNATPTNNPLSKVSLSSGLSSYPPFVDELVKELLYSQNKDDLLTWQGGHVSLLSGKSTPKPGTNIVDFTTKGNKFFVSDITAIECATAMCAAYGRTLNVPSNYNYNVSNDMHLYYNYAIAHGFSPSELSNKANGTNVVASTNIPTKAPKVQNLEDVIVKEEKPAPKIRQEQDLGDIKKYIPQPSPWTQTATDEEKATTHKEMINFFSEFDFEPSVRIMSTLGWCKNLTECNEYIYNVFKLMNSPYTNGVSEKMKSHEWEELAKKVMYQHNTEIVVNKRLMLFYGAPGGGKTYTATSLCPNAPVIGCSQNDTWEKLLNRKDFSKGISNMTIVDSVIVDAMANGTPVVLDELGLLPIKELSAMQAYLDNKNEIYFNGATHTIKDGFMIIGTMNLKRNGIVYPLPEAIVDRAFYIKEFRMMDNVNTLAKAW